VEAGESRSTLHQIVLRDLLGLVVVSHGYYYISLFVSFFDIPVMTFPP
jgi:hypothetical protein